MQLSNRIEYKKQAIDYIRKLSYGINWPVVYLIYNSDNIYVGETLDVKRRTEEHLAETKFKNFSEIRLITDDTFNKSVILDLESFLIKYIGSEGKRKIINGNAGVEDHNFYNKEKYVKEYSVLWKELISERIVNKEIKDIENSVLFKYSPYKSLSEDQKTGIKNIFDALLNDKKSNAIVVKGGAGTGKTILAIYIIKMINDLINGKNIKEDSDLKYLNNIRKYYSINKISKIGLVIPMTELRSKIKKVFKYIDGLSEYMVYSPSEVIGKKFDLLIVDEAHRLYKNKFLTSASAYKKFNDINKKLMGTKFTGTEDDYTELDWILMNSRKTILFYDKRQIIRVTDIGNDRFMSICSKHNYNDDVSLKSQLRCKDDGTGYYEYIEKILFTDGLVKTDKQDIKNYHTKVFDNAQEMVDSIAKLNKDNLLCHVVAGPAWSRDEDIVVDEKKYKWYSGKKREADNPHFIYSIHRIQGFDLNYAGVIFSKEIAYDKKKKEIIIKQDLIKDKRANPTGNYKSTKEFILNIYLTLMTRGINGTYVYAMDKDLNEYLKMFLN